MYLMRPDPTRFTCGALPAPRYSPKCSSVWTGTNITHARLLDTLEGIDNCKGSDVPVVDIGEVCPGDEAVKHLLVPGS